MNKTPVLLIIGLALAFAHRLPAPIQEVQESATPTPEQSAKPKAKRVMEPKTERTATPSRAATTPTPAPAKKFAGTWVGVTSTFPWGDISQTITVDPTETTITMVSTNGPDSGKPGVAKAQRNGDTLKGNFGNRGTYTLTALGDRSTVLVRLQAPFNDNTASYHRMAETPKSSR